MLRLDRPLAIGNRLGGVDDREIDLRARRNSVEEGRAVRRRLRRRRLRHGSAPSRASVPQDGRRRLGERPSPRCDAGFGRRWRAPRTPGRRRTRVDALPRAHRRGAARRVTRHRRARRCARRTRRADSRYASTASQPRDRPEPHARRRRARPARAFGPELGRQQGCDEHQSALPQLRWCSLRAHRGLRSVAAIEQQRLGKVVPVGHVEQPRPQLVVLVRVARRRSWRRTAGRAARGRCDRRERSDGRTASRRGSASGSRRRRPAADEPRRCGRPRRARATLVPTTASRASPAAARVVARADAAARRRRRPCARCSGCAPARSRGSEPRPARSTPRCG